MRRISSNAPADSQIKADVCQSGFFSSFFFGEWLSVAIKGFLVTTGNPRTVLLDKVVK